MRRRGEVEDTLSARMGGDTVSIDRIIEGTLFFGTGKEEKWLKEV
jgi:hypothetical protein